MSSNLDTVIVERSPLEIGHAEVLHSALASLWRRKLLVGAIVASAVALGIIALLLIPPSYSPTAYIRGGFVVSTAVARDQDSKGGGPYIGVDLTRMIETQSRLLQSEELAHRVVKQLGLEKLKPELVERHWLPVRLFISSADDQEYPSSESNSIDRASMMLLSRLSVTSDQLRTYMIKVSYAGNDPVLAVEVTNAFVAEFLRSSRLQVLAQQRSSAGADLATELNTFGEKHPRVMQAKVRLANLEALEQRQLNEAADSLLQAASESVTEATSATLTSSPKPRLVIGLMLVVGLFAGITVALYLERNKWAETFSHYMKPFA